MLTPSAMATANRYWAGHLGCSPEGFLAEPVLIVTHGPELADYAGVFALFRDGAAVVSMPPDRATSLRELFAGRMSSLSPETLASILNPMAESVIGPAYIGYATHIAPSGQPARTLVPDDVAALHALQQACSPLEWEHGGSDRGQPCSGVFVDGVLAALAGYEIWGGAIAHIAVVTHPAYRGRGYGRATVAHLTQRALVAGLLPQYRTLEANTPSMRIARDLGFQSYARSLAIRLRPPA